MGIPDNAGKVWDYGLQPWPVRHDGSKAPREAGWGPDELPERLPREQTVAMFEATDTGMGIITGVDNVELFEFEGRFVIEDGYDEFVSACNDRDLGDVLETVRQGYEAASPSGGIHLLLRTEKARASEVLAKRDVDGTIRPLIETKGVGGFAILAGSNGQVHPNGGAWRMLRGKPKTIATITCEDRDALYALAREFDEAPDKPRFDARLRSAGPGIGLEGDDPTPLYDHVLATIGVRPLLIEAGWELARTTRRPSELWRRPGKSWAWSGELLEDGWFNVYTSTLTQPWRTALGGHEQLSPIGVLAAVRYDGDVKAAMSATRRSMTGIPTTTPSGEPLELNLPAEFWETNDLLRDVRDAAWAQVCSPDAVLGALLVRYAAVVHPSIVLPGLGSLDLFTVCVGHSGAGKSQAAKTARMLFPGTDKRGVLLDLPVGSGEGLVEKFFRFEDEEGKPCSSQKKGAEKVQWLHGLHFTADEGMALAAQAGRMGSTLIPTLCAAWMGETLGQTNASVATSRSIGPNKARLTAQINIQTMNGHKLFSEAYASTGLAQRMLCVHAQDPRISEPSWSPPAMPAPLVLPLPAIGGALRTLEVADEIREEISTARRAAHSPTWVGDPLDTHRLMVQLKMAALLSLMSGKLGVELAEWKLAELIYETHRHLRSLLQQSAVAELKQQGALRIQTEVEKAVAVRTAVHRSDVHRTIDYLRRRIEAGQSILSRDIGTNHRDLRDEALEVLAMEPGSRLQRDSSEGWRVV